MKDKKFSILIKLAVAWLFFFLLTLRVKSPLIEQLDILILFICVCWFGYWTLSFFRGKSMPPDQDKTNIIELKQVNAKSKSKKTPESV